MGKHAGDDNNPEPTEYAISVLNQVRENNRAWLSDNRSRVVIMSHERLDMLITQAVDIAQKDLY